ncbi:MAG: glycogen/starch/alpha-glucan phosphorylase [Candidatus Saccharimonadaceae bacterium]|nr:glycogen/starch/alpha-glucan phosphorylase [Candidatus Saccharimonadaceae bacterium]
MEEEKFFYHPLENIEDVDLFYEAVERNHLTKAISPGRPYTYWTLELYDQRNGIRGGGGLGVLAADTRRVAEKLGVPFALITPFYPYETHQIIKDGTIYDDHVPVKYEDYGFKFIDTVNVKCCDTLCELSVIEKRFKNTRIIGITEPNFGELYSGMSGSDHRLYQEVALGFGGYAALKLLGLKPAIMQLNEVATFFAALARLDELTYNGMDFYEAMVYTRKHTLYTNHTLVQAAEAEFGYEQFEKFVFPNIKSLAVKKWLKDKFAENRLKLSSVTIEIAELRSGVSKLHARVANYHDVAGNKVKFKAVTNGIDMDTWVMPDVMNYYHEIGVLDEYNLPTPNYMDALDTVSADKIRELKKVGRKILNDTLKDRPDHTGNILKFGENDFIFDFKRRFVDYKRPDLPFRDPARLRNILEPRGAHYIISGRVHSGDKIMYNKLQNLLKTIGDDDYLSGHVHYIPDYDEKLAYGLSVGCNAAINVPIVGLEACGTSWMKDIANLSFLISTHDGGVADASINSYLNVSGANEDEELDMLYQRMEEALSANENDFDLEYMLRQQLKAYLPVISGSRMLQDYIDFLFPR